MSREIDQDIWVNNMAMPYFALAPVEFSGWFSVKVLKAEGLCYVPTKMGVLQTNHKIFTRHSNIGELHENWRTEKPGKKGLRQIYNSYKKEDGSFLPALGTYLTMPQQDTSIDHFTEVQKVVGRLLPYVYSDYPNFENKPQTGEVSVQISQDFLNRFNIKNEKELRIWLAKGQLYPCLDFAKTEGLSNDVINYLFQNATQVHIPVKRSYGKELLSLTELSVLSKLPNLKSIVIESTYASPKKLKYVILLVKKELSK